MNNIQLTIKDKDGNDFHYLSFDTEKMLHAVIDHSYPREILKIIHERLVYLAYEKKYEDSVDKHPLSDSQTGRVTHSAKEKQLAAQKELKEFLNLLVELK